MGRVVSFEMSSQHPEVAVQFYSNVFGWKMGQPRWDYWPADTGAGEQRGIHGGIALGPGDHPHGTRVIIEVDSIDDAVALALSHGAKVVRNKMDFEDFYMAYLIDPVGNQIGLIQNK